LGICVDSAHLFGAGYDLRTPTAVEDTLEQADSAFGLDRIKVFHLNDTELEFGSRKDRHARIAKGRLGKEGIASIVNNEFLRQLPFILETPTEGPLDYRPQLELIRELASTDK
jgi:deoxyribonuclease-4